MFPLLMLTLVAAQDTAMPCLGEHPHGSTIHLEKYWYKCDNGALIGQGCFGQDGSLMQFDEVLEAGGLSTKCTMNAGGEPRLEYLGCIQNGRQYGANEFWNNDGLWYFCEQRGVELILNFGGCVDEKGKRIAKGQQTVRDNVIFLCQEETTTANAGLKPLGCMHYAKRYELGAKFNDDNVYYICRRTNNSAKRIALGCVFNEERLKNGQRFVQNRVMYQCQVIADDTDAVKTPIGCITDRGIKSTGQRWIEGENKFRYEVECKVRDTIAMPVPVNCAYFRKNLPVKHIDGGCFIIDGSEAIACQRNKADASITYTIFEAKHAAYAEIDFGVRNCETETTQTETNEIGNRKMLLHH